MINYKEAKEKIVYTLDHENNIVETTLYDHIMLSIEECTSPRGCEPRLHIRHDDETDIYGLYLWARGNNRLTHVQDFETKEEAKQDLFMRTYEYDFLPDDQRFTEYFDTEEEAMEFQKERSVKTLYYILNKKTDESFDTMEMKFYSNSWEPVLEDDEDFLQSLIDEDPDKFKDCIIETKNFGL